MLFNIYVPHTALALDHLESHTRNMMTFIDTMIDNESDHTEQIILDCHFRGYFATLRRLMNWRIGNATLSQWV